MVKQRLAPAYLFAGADGLGKSLTARYFIELLLCDRTPPSEHPLILQKLRQGNHPDVLWILPSYSHQGRLYSANEASAAGIKRKTPPQIRIDQIREIAQFLSRPPLIGERAVVVIDRAETMAEGAANALLKTLEEPGKATIILIALSVDTLLPTIISRCQRVPFQRIDRALLIEILTKLGRVDIVTSPDIIGLAQGSPGAAMAIWEQLQAMPSGLLEQITTLPMTRRQGLELAVQIDKELDSAEQLWLLDYLQYSYWQTYQLPHLVETLEQARSHLLAYVQPRLVWECAFLKIAKPQA